MNGIAARRHELERLLKDLSGDIASAGITFLTSVDAYITRLDANCPDISDGVNPVPAHMDRRIKMEPTLTQNCALYYAQHKSSKPRASFFQRFRPATRKQAPETYQQLTHGTHFRRLPFHRDNGR
jgi:hypothetical protein